MISVDSMFWRFVCTENQQQRINCEKSAGEKEVRYVSLEGEAQT